MEKMRDIIDEATLSNDRFWREFRRQLDDPQFPTSVDAATRRIATPIGIKIVKASLLRLDAFMVTGLVQVAVRSIREVNERLRFNEDFLQVKFIGQPEWFSKTTYRERQIVERDEEELIQ